MTFHPDSLPDLSGRVHIVTGGTSGIGFYTAARLAQHGAHVYLCARSEAKGQKAVGEVQALYPKAQVSVLVMDHTSLSSVLSAADNFLTRETALHGLVNNAGIMAVPFEMTGDRNEIQWQTNYLAHWVFTERLLPLMLETSKTVPSGGVRIVNVSSGGHMMAPKPGINYQDVTLETDTPIVRYGQSKLANMLHARTLNKLYGPSSSSSKAGKGEIWSSSVQPGVVTTGLDDKATEMPTFMRMATFVINAVGARWPPDKGAWTNVFCVASPDMKADQSGISFERIAKPASIESSKAKDMNLANDLQEWTQKEMKRQGWV